MACFGRTGSGSRDRPTDFKAAMRSLDAERKRVHSLSAALTLQRAYTTQLEDAALCLEKTLSAFPDGDFQLTLVAGLREKQRKEFEAAMNKLNVDEHLFHDDPTGQLDDSHRQVHRRPSFKERARKRASAIFNSHAQGKAQVQQRASERATKQRERLERRLQARIDEARTAQLKGQKVTPSLKRAVQKLTKQILAFKSVHKDHTFERDGVMVASAARGARKVGGDDSVLVEGEAALRARNKRNSELEASGVLDGMAGGGADGNLMIPVAAGHPNNIVNKAREAGINMSRGLRQESKTQFNEKFMDAKDVKYLNEDSVAESPYVQLARAFLEANEQLTHLGKLVTDDALITWVVDCNLLVLIVMDRMIELYGPLPEPMLDLMNSMFASINWNFYCGKNEQSAAHAASTSSHKGYRAAISSRLTEYMPLAREEYEQWCGKCMDILHKKFQEKKSHVIRSIGPGVAEQKQNSNAAALSSSLAEDDYADSPYVALASCFSTAGALIRGAMRRKSEHTTDDISSWLLDLNVSVARTIEICETQHGAMPLRITNVIRSLFEKVKWVWMTPEVCLGSRVGGGATLPRVPRGYVPPVSAVELLAWCEESASNLHGHFKNKLKSLAGDEVNALATDEKVAETFTSHGGVQVNPPTAETSSDHESAQKESAEMASILYGDDEIFDIPESKGEEADGKVKPSLVKSPASVLPDVSDEKHRKTRNHPTKVASQSTLRRHSEAEEMLYSELTSENSAETRGPSFELGKRLRKVMAKKYKKNKKFDAMWAAASKDDHLSMAEAKTLCTKELGLTEDIQDEVFFPIWLAMLGGQHEKMLHPMTSDLCSQPFRAWCLGKNDLPICISGN